MLFIWNTGCHQWDHHKQFANYCNHHWGYLANNTVLWFFLKQNAISGIGASNLMAVLTIHTYGSMWIFPFSDTLQGVCRRAPDHNDLVKHFFVY